MSGDRLEQPKTLSVPEAGKLYFNLSRNSSYEAASRGELPTIRIGKLLRVPVVALERMLSHRAPESPQEDRRDSGPNSFSTGSRS
jgi:hypothetical protein